MANTQNCHSLSMVGFTKEYNINQLVIDLNFQPRYVTTTTIFRAISFENVRKPHALKLQFGNRS